MSVKSLFEIIYATAFILKIKKGKNAIFIAFYP